MTADSNRVARVLAIVALLVFAWLALRHVHESVFLEDQTDQLQNFESLVGGDPYALLGPTMSDTRPTAHALGPLGAIVFGIPVALGFAIDGIHVVTSMLIAGATAFAFVVLLRIDAPFAWLWFWMFAATGLVWWNVGLLWVNTLLLPAGLLLLGLAASCLSRPRALKIALLMLTALFALQVHLAAIVATPVVVILAVVSAREALQRPLSRRASAAVAVLSIVALGPYLLAEARTGLQNSRAIVAHLRHTSDTQPLAVDTARRTLLIAIDPTGMLASAGLPPVAILSVGAGLAAIVAVALSRRARRRATDPEAAAATCVMLWLAVSAIAAVIAQALFFLLMRRPLAGYHYVTLLAPFYSIVPAAFLREVLARPLQHRRAVPVVACACVTFLVWTGPSHADRAMAPAMWSYRNIVSAVNDLCDGGAADVAEGPGFAAVLNPRYDGVLQYLMKRHFADCRYEPGSAVLIAASRDAHYEDSYVRGDRRYRRDTVRYPGIALYRRVR